jgi:hypothetical protein
MIEVTFKFDSIEKAIATLGSIMKGAPVPTAADPAKPEAAAPTGKQRKPRADAGKARGPYKDNGVATPPAPAEADNAQPSGEVPAEVTPPETAAPEVSSRKDTDETGGSANPSAAAATQEQAQAALETLFATKGLPTAQTTMALFGVSRLRDMKPEDYGQFVIAAQEATK